ncbi:response regulator transcription factor [Chryseomicrobium sp. FSL W7-1435]|uniref:response regulator transcription factor n=1 Tax=Chryseomicrobium sp. FSL W7-1435 TaxID=2921704 RepID=UPI00315A9ECF
MAETILIVEDELKIARVLQLELEYEGYKTKLAHTGMDGLLLFRDGGIDLVILDVMLPEMNGFEVLKRIRATDEQIPVILVTAKSTVKDKVEGLDLGANDYITKPFEMEEVFARIRSALRRANSEKIEGIHVGGIIVDEARHEVKVDQHSVQLTPREFELLAYFMKNPLQVLTREQILDAVWGYDYYGDTNVVDVYVRYIRKKIDTPERTFIQTVRGVGYLLKETRHEA